MAISNNQALPWYREPWPWILMAGPFVVVVAGFITLWLAIKTNDGLVDIDYYQRGLAINQTLYREKQASILGLRGELKLNPDHTRATLKLSAASGRPLPPVLQLRVIFPAKAGKDQMVRLQTVGQGVYQGALSPPTPGKWQLILEDAAKTWRLTSDLQVPAAGVTILEPAPTF